MKSKNLIEWVFKNESAIREKVNEKKDISYIGAACGNMGGGGNSISRPTENMGIILADEIMKVSIKTGPNGGSLNLCHPERWLKMIDATKKYFSGTIEADIINECYRGGKSNDDFIRDHKLSRTTFYDMKNSVLCVAFGAAIVQGLVLRES